MVDTLQLLGKQLDITRNRSSVLFLLEKSRYDYLCRMTLVERFVTDPQQKPLPYDHEIFFISSGRKYQELGSRTPLEIMLCQLRFLFLPNSSTRPSKGIMQSFLR